MKYLHLPESRRARTLAIVVASLVDGLSCLKRWVTWEAAKMARHQLQKVGHFAWEIASQLVVVLLV